MQSVSDLYHSSPTPAPSHPWEPREHLHVDYAAHFTGKMPLIVVDVYSKWMEVEVATSAVTIEHLQAMFAIHGLPEVLVSDNGTVFCMQNLTNLQTIMVFAISRLCLITPPQIG